MNTISYALMKEFVAKHLGHSGLSVCDVGSLNINGTFKPLFVSHNYTGVDIVSGPNVDFVSEQQYLYPFLDESFDVMISGSTLEHVEDIFSWVKELARIVKKGGLVCVIAPSIHRNKHCHPVDCWRIYPDGMAYLLGKVAGLEMLECKRSNIKAGTVECIGVGRK